MKNINNIKKDLVLAFDFDGCLSRPDVQKYAKKLVDRGYEVWIVTRRYRRIEDYTDIFCIAYGIVNLKEQHEYLFTVAEECGIPMERVHYTNMQDKWKFFKDKDFLWHLDDDPYELKDINANTNTVGISVFGNYKSKCERLIKRYERK